MTPVALAILLLAAALLLVYRRVSAKLRWQADLLDQSYDAILAWKPGGTIAYWNRGAEELYGWSAADARGRMSHELLRTEHAAGTASIERILAREGRWQGILHHVTRDGRKIAVEARLSLVRYGGRAAYVIESNRDITARVAREEALRESAARLRRLWESSIIGVMIATADGGIRDANDAILRMIGYTREEVAAGEVRWSDLTPPEYRSRDEAGIAVARARGACTPYEKVYVDKQGRRVPILIGYALVPDSGCDFVCFALDLTERRRAERARDESEARLRAIFDTAADAIITIDERGVVDRFNAAAERIFGYRADEVVGHDLTMLMPAADREAHEGYVARYLRTGERRVIGRGREVLGRRKDGKLVALELAVSETLIGDHRLFTGILRDVTERRRIEEEREQLLASERAARSEAERAARMRDEFVATVSHELRTPLNAILGWSSMLRKGRRDPAMLDKALDVIERNAHAQAQIVEDLLDVSRILSGKLRVDVQRLHLAPVVENAVAAVLPAAEAKGVRVDGELCADAGTVQGDPSRLEQVVINLLTNAVKFTPKGGRVTVVLRRAGDRAEIAVRDTGQGICPDLLPHIFDRYRQGDSSITRKHAGLGLGLALVKHLVEQHGGEVRADSEGEGLGATFLVSLPTDAAQRAGAERASPLDACASLDGVRVLVVDDEEDARDLVRRILEDCGADVVAVGSASEAIEELPRAKYDVLLSDIGMPELDGYHLMRNVRALPPEHGGKTPAVALTAFSRPEDRLRALRVGYQMHLTKPVDQAELIVVVANLAGRLAA
jgi:PAS domain S-box-containing protein